MKRADDTLVGAIRKAARPLMIGPSDYDELMDLFGTTRFVLLKRWYEP